METPSWCCTNLPFCQGSTPDHLFKTAPLTLTVCRLCKASTTSPKDRNSFSGIIFFPNWFKRDLWNLRDVWVGSALWMGAEEVLRKETLETVSLGCTGVNVIYSESWVGTERASPSSDAPAYLWTGFLSTAFVTSKAVVGYPIRALEGCLSSEHKANL